MSRSAFDKIQDREYNNIVISIFRNFLGGSNYMFSQRIFGLFLGLLLTAAIYAGCAGPTKKIEPTVQPKPPRRVIAYSPLTSGATISTFAGGGVGDGRLAIEASLYTPQAIKIDSDNNIYIADTGHHRIRRVDAKTGIITTVAGTGIQGNIGDHGRGIRAQLSSPHGMAFDMDGKLYVADTDNQRLRKLDKKGNLHPSFGKKSDAEEAALPEDHDHSLMFMDSGGEDIVLAPPHHIDVDSQGNIYITEMESNLVSKIDHATKNKTVIAGKITAPGFSGDGGPGAEASLLSPHGVGVDASGNVYIADTLNHRIRQIDAKTGIITTIAGSGLVGFVGDGGLATRARLAGPSGLAISPDGTLYIVDTDNRRIRKLTPFGSEWRITTVAGTGHRGSSGDGGPALEADLVRPVAIAVDTGGNLYISDTGGHKVRKVDTLGIITTVAGNGHCCFTGDGQHAMNAEFSPPYGISVGPAGDVYIVDRDNHRIRRVDRSNAVITTVAGIGSRGYRGDGGQASNASLSDPMSVAVSKDGSVFIADYGNHRIRKVDGETGIITTVVGSSTAGFEGDGAKATRAKLHFPAGAALDSEGNLYISDTGNQRVRMVKHDTGVITTIAGTGDYGFSGDGGSATEADLAHPTSLGFDQEGSLYIADTDNHRVRKVNKGTGTITTVVGNGNSRLTGDGGPALLSSLRYPSGVIIDQDTLYIADSGHHLIRMVSLKTGVITTLAGRGWPGLEGDGGPAAKAVLRSPHGIALYSKTLYIADTDNRRIRSVILQSLKSS
jgi:sugar lactone lactonase YvrE